MNHVIILAAGKGIRMKNRKDKMLLEAGEKPIIYYSIMAYNDHPDIETIAIVVNKTNKKEIEKITKTYNFSKVKKITLGGITRQNSLEKGMCALPKSIKKNDIVLVHNGANPLPSFEEISEVIHMTEEHGACITGHFAESTIKEVNENQIVKTHDRDRFMLAETPQAAKFQILKKASENAKKKKLEVTDEAMLLEAIDQKITYVKADESNFKITTQADYERLKSVLGDLPEDFRVGIGQDSHVFEEEKKGLVLGGLEFKDEFKLKANSDGDVILHAIFNALSQSIGDMSIGFYADEACEQGIIDSKKYIELIIKKVKKEKFQINSVGLMIECKTPKIDTIVGKLKKSLSQILGIETNRIGITATSGEETTVWGTGVGIQCFAIVSLHSAKR